MGLKVFLSPALRSEEVGLLNSPPSVRPSVRSLCQQPTLTYFLSAICPISCYMPQVLLPLRKTPLYYQGGGTLELHVCWFLVVLCRQAFFGMGQTQPENIISVDKILLYDSVFGKRVLTYWEKKGKIREIKVTTT